MLLLNLLLALAWLLLTGQFTPANFVFGFGLTYLLLWFFQRAIGADQQSAQRAAYFRRVGQLIRFSLFFLKELIVANLRVARDVLRFRPQMQPAVVTLPLTDFSDAEVTMLANFITLTPGTLSLDVIDGVAPNGHDGSRLLQVHAMHAGSGQPAIDHFARALYEQYARRVQEVMR